LEVDFFRHFLLERGEIGIILRRIVSARPVHPKAALKSVFDGNDRAWQNQAEGCDPLNPARRLLADSQKPAIGRHFSAY
jgi:hypothetical protein